MSAMTRTIYPKDFCVAMSAEFAKHALGTTPETFDDLVLRALDKSHALGFEADGTFSYRLTEAWAHPIWESLSPNVQSAREDMERWKDSSGR